MHLKMLNRLAKHEASQVLYTSAFANFQIMIFSKLGVVN